MYGKYNNTDNQEYDYENQIEPNPGTQLGPILKIHNFQIQPLKMINDQLKGYI